MRSAAGAGASCDGLDLNHMPTVGQWLDRLGSVSGYTKITDQRRREAYKDMQRRGL